MVFCHRLVVAANILNEKVGVIHAISGIFLWRTSMLADDGGRGLKNLDIFQSKQKEGSDDVKRDQLEKRVGDNFLRTACTHKYKETVLNF